MILSRDELIAHVEEAIERMEFWNLGVNVDESVALYKNMLNVVKALPENNSKYTIIERTIYRLTDVTDDLLNR